MGYGDKVEYSIKGIRIPLETSVGSLKLMNVSDRRLCAYVYFDILRITQVGIRSRSLTGLSNVDSR